MAAFEARLNDEFGGDLGSPILVAVAGSAEFDQSGSGLFILAGVTAGTVANLIIGIGPTPVYAGVGAGAGVTAFQYKKHRENLLSPNQPSGSYVIIAVSATHLLIFDKSPLARGAQRISAQVPLDEVATVEVPDRPRRNPITISLHNGERWQYVVPQWGRVRDALPERLRT